MKKLLLFLIIALSPCCYLLAQDLVITAEGDSINAKIIDLSKEQVSFVYQEDGQMKWKRKKFTQVKGFVSKYYSTTEVEAEEALKFGQRYSPLRIELNGGWAYMYRHEKIGYNLNAEISHYFSPFWGIGFNYGYNKFKLSQLRQHEENLYTLSDNYDITYQYFMPTIIAREYSLNKKNAGIFSFGLGYVNYKGNIKSRLVVSNGERYNEKNSTSGGSVSFMLGAGYDIGLSRHFAIGIKGNFIVHMTGSYKQNSGTPDYGIERAAPEHLINLTLGLRYLK